MDENLSASLFSKMTSSTSLGDLVKHIVDNPWADLYEESIGDDIYESGADFNFSEDFGYPLQDKLSKMKQNAYLAFSNKEFDKAAEHLTKAMEQKCDAELLKQRADCYLQLGELDACMKDCNDALQIYSEYIDVYKIRGCAYMRLGKWKEAEKDLRFACNGLLESDSQVQAFQMLKNVLRHIPGSEDLLEFSPTDSRSLIIRLYIGLEQYETIQDRFPSLLGKKCVNVHLENSSEGKILQLSGIKDAIVDAIFHLFSSVKGTLFVLLPLTSFNTLMMCPTIKGIEELCRATVHQWEIILQENCLGVNAPNCALSLIFDRICFAILEEQVDKENIPKLPKNCSK